MTVKSACLAEVQLISNQTPTFFPYWQFEYQTSPSKEIKKQFNFVVLIGMKLDNLDLITLLSVLSQF